MRRPLAIALTLALAGCSYTFDDSPPDLPLLGAPPAMDRLPRLNHAPAYNLSIVRGADHAYWAAIQEPVGEGSQLRQGIHLVRLSPPAKESYLDADRIVVGPVSFYLLDDQPMGTKLTVVQAGQSAPPPTFMLAAGPVLLVPSPDDSVFLVAVGDANDHSFQIIHLDGSYSRTVSLPDATSAADLNGAAFSRDSSLVFTRNSDGHVWAHATSADHDVDLGVLPDLLVTDNAHQQLVGCDYSGLRTMKWDGSAARVLDRAGCDDQRPLWLDGTNAYYTLQDGETRQAALAGSPPPVTLLASGRLIGFGPGRSLLYSKDGPERYINGAGDGWLGAWRFMERGRSVSFSSDGKRLRWLEHAARNNGSGDLLSADLATEQPLRLARNVWTYDQLSDGRVIAAANQAFAGAQNRVVVIDEQARVQHWVAAEAQDYLFVPGSSDILVDVVTGGSTFDVVRVPIPPK